MNKQLKGVIAGTAIVAAMGVAGLGIVGNAHAQSARMNFVGASNLAMVNGNGSMAGPGDGRGPGKNVAAIASVLKLTEAELKTQVQSGTTLAQIATAQGVDVKLVVDAIVTEIKTHIASEVTSGEITQAQADAKLADVTTKVTEMVNTARPARGEGMRGGPKGPGKNVAAIASVLKLTEAELKTQVQSGKTLAQIATTQGVDVKLVVDAIVTEIKTHIASEVTSGEITQAQADAKLADVTTKVTEMVNTARPARGEGMRGGPKGRGRHHDNDGDEAGENPNA